MEIDCGEEEHDVGPWTQALLSNSQWRSLCWVAGIEATKIDMFHKFQNLLMTKINISIAFIA